MLSNLKPQAPDSILKLIERRFGLEPLTERDAAASNMLAAFDFGR